MLISVIIPCYNVETYIEACLDTVLQQSHQELEIIVIDNNSTDGTVAKIQAYQSKYANIIFDVETKQGAPAARNKGLSLARGTWIQFMDADDLLLPQKIANQLTQTKADIPFIAGLPVWRQLDGSDIMVGFKRDCWKDLFEGSLGYTSSNLWNKRYLDQIGGWTESVSHGQDYDLMFRLLQKSTNIVYTAEPHSIHQDRKRGQITKSDLRQNWELIVRLRLKIIDYLKEEAPSYFQENQLYFEQMLYRLIRGLANQDIMLATQYYKAHLANRQVPVWMPSCPVPLWNIISLSILGFEKTELLRRKLLNLKS